MAAWQVWALMSFAALTAICAKVGVEQVSPDVATPIGTAVIVVVLTTVTAATRQLPALVRARCARRSLDKLSIALVALFGVGFLGERLAPMNWLGILMIAVGAWFVALKT